MFYGYLKWSAIVALDKQYEVDREWNTFGPANQYLWICYTYTYT